jgi:hypothetical protein
MMTENLPFIIRYFILIFKKPENKDYKTKQHYTFYLFDQKIKKNAQFYIRFHRSFPVFKQRILYYFLRITKNLKSKS